MDYLKNSHIHCWNNENNPCGIPLEKHTQCYLCDEKYMQDNYKELSYGELD